MTDNIQKEVEEEVEEEGFKFGIRHIAFICATIGLCSAPLSKYEGDILKSYPDIGGRWTACKGVADVIPNHLYKKSECDQMNKKALIVKVIGVTDYIKVPVSPAMAAAHVTFAYNVGLGNYHISKTLRLTNEGKFAEGCQAMMDFYKAGGHNCWQDKGKIHGCYGLIVRRQDEVNRCMKGIE